MNFFDSKVILIVSPEPWDHIFVSKHHYASILSKMGNSVFFLEPSGDIDHIQKANDYLWIIRQARRFKGIRYLPIVFQGLLFKMQFRSIERKISRKIDIIWNFDPSRFFQLSNLRGILKIAHIVDLNQVFQRHILCRTSDVVLCSSHLLKRELSKFNSNTFFIHHGYNLVNLRRKKYHNKRVQAYYIGNLSYRYLDWDTILETVIQNPEVDFHFIGPQKVGANQNSPPSKILGLGNAKFYLPIPANEIPIKLQCADLLFLVYREDSRSQMGNPHKMMEYLGSGKPIISTYTQEFSNLDYIEMVENNDEFPSKFHNLAQNIKQQTKKELENKRIQFAMDNSYEKQILRIEALIQTL